MKRSVFSGAVLAVAAGCVVLSFGHAQAAVVIADNFTDGPSVLNGRTTTTGNVQWVDASVDAFGTVGGGTLTASGANNTAILPFTPGSDIYTLSATVTTTAAWIALGFQVGANEAAPWDGNGMGWSRLATGQVWASGGPWAANEVTIGGLAAGPHVIALTLDTTQAQWTFSGTVDGASIGATYTFPTNPAIDHIWVGRADNATGSIQNLQLTSGVVPEPASLATIGLAGLLGLRRRRA